MGECFIAFIFGFESRGVSMREGSRHILDDKCESGILCHTFAITIDNHVVSCDVISEFLAWLL